MLEPVLVSIRHVPPLFTCKRLLKVWGAASDGSIASTTPLEITVRYPYLIHLSVLLLWLVSFRLVFCFLLFSFVLFAFFVVVLFFVVVSFLRFFFCLFVCFVCIIVVFLLLLLLLLLLLFFGFCSRILYDCRSCKRPYQINGN